MATTTPPPDAYALTDEQLEFRDAIRKMVVERVAPARRISTRRPSTHGTCAACSPSTTCSGCPSTPSTGAPGMLNVAVEEVARACGKHEHKLGIKARRPASRSSTTSASRPPT